jgi:hypothetical protein
MEDGQDIARKTAVECCIMTRAVGKGTVTEINHILCDQTRALYLDDLLQQLQHCAAVVSIQTALLSTTNE